jgi:hypothetical protein
MRENINTSTGLPKDLNAENLRSTDRSNSSSEMDHFDDVRDPIIASHTHTYEDMKKYFHQA